MFILSTIEPSVPLNQTCRRVLYVQQLFGSAIKNMHLCGCSQRGQELQSALITHSIPCFDGARMITKRDPDLSFILQNNILPDVPLNGVPHLRWHRAAFLFPINSGMPFAFELG
jgi:hypothetical protein